jgi:hypothetical protein
VVLFAGIAAEAVIYGEAEGGESDERLYVHVVKSLRPPWSPAKVNPKPFKSGGTLRGFGALFGGFPEG